MTDCPNGEVRDLLPDYLHDRLEPSARTSVARHLEACADCRAELALLRDLRGTLRRAPQIDVGTIAAAIPPYRAPVRRSWTAVWRVAAAIVAIAVGGTSLAVLGRVHHPAQVAQLPAARPTAPAPDADSVTAAPSVPLSSSRPASTEPRPEPAVTRAPAPRGEELAMAGGAIADLSDGELSDLLGEIESLDALPSTDVESAEPLLPTARGRRP